jgi:uncharacterized membrane protein
MPDAAPAGGGPTLAIGHRSWQRVAIAAIAGILVGVLAGLMAGWDYTPPVSWITAGTVFLARTWYVIGRMDQPTTAAHASREEPGVLVAELVVLIASVASLGGVAYLLGQHGASTGWAGTLRALIGVASVAVAWLVVHTLYTLRYARLYYVGEDGGIDFPQAERPQYSDFAYLAFTIGMTYQVSDTALTSRAVRSAATKHALLSYLFGAVILAATVNAVIGLGGIGLSG